MRYYILFVIIFFNTASESSADNKFADSCYVAGINEYKKSHYTNALHLFEKCDSTNKRNNRIKPYYSSNSIIWISRCYYMIGDSIKAESLLTNRWGTSFRIEPTDQRTTIKSDSIAFLVDKLEAINDYKKAISTVDKLIQVEEEILDSTHTYIANSYLHKGILLLKINNFSNALLAFEKSAQLWIQNDYRSPNTLLYITNFINHCPIDGSIEVYERILDSIRNIPDVDITFYIKMLCPYAVCYDVLGLHHNSDLTKEEIFKKIKQARLNDTVLHADILSILGLAYYNVHDCEKAIKYFKEELELRQKKSRDEDLAIATTLKNIHNCYYSQKRYIDALTFAKKALRITENKLGKEHPNSISAKRTIEKLNFYLGNIPEAINLNKEVLDVQEKITGKDSKEYLAILTSLATYHSKSKNYSESIKITEDILKKYENIEGKETLNYTYNLLTLAILYSYVGNHLESTKKNTEAMMIIEKIAGKESPIYADAITNLAIEKDYLGCVDDALNLHKEALKIRKKILGTDHSDYILSLENLAKNYKTVGKYNEAIKLIKEALKTKEKKYGKEHRDYVYSLQSLAFVYFDINNYPEAIRLFTEVLDIQEKLNGKTNINIIASLKNLALTYEANNDYQESIILYSRILDIYKKNFGDSHPEYIKTLSCLAYAYWQVHNFPESIKSYTRAIELHKKTFGENNSDYINMLQNLAQIHSEIHYYHASIKLYTEALNIHERIIGKANSKYTSILGAIAGCNCANGNYSETIRLIHEAMKIQESINDKDNIDYASLLFDLAIAYIKIGDKSKSLMLISELSTICNKLLEMEVIDKNEFSILLAYLYILEGNSDETLKITYKLHETIKKSLNKQNQKYVESLFIIANIYTYLGFNVTAREAIEEALEISEKLYKKKHPEYVKYLVRLADYNLECRNYQKATRIYNQALYIANKSSNKNQSLYCTILEHLIFCYKNTNRIKEYIDLMDKYLKQQFNNIVSTTQTLVPREQEVFWGEQGKKLEFMSFNQTYEYNNPGLNKLAYNSSLLIKGFLLGAEIETKKIIQESGDKSIINLYEELSLNKSFLEKLYEIPISERYLSTDSLEQVIEEQERLLALKSTDYGSIMNNMSITWKDVQKNLKQNDIAIEFVSFPLNKDSVIYIAYTIKKDYDAPKMIKLFEEKQLKSIRPARFYKGKNIYNLVWASLEDELSGVNNVYFSPTGELYNINIEILPQIAGIEEKRNYYRLSSTRELAYKHIQSKRKNNAVVYGGMKYDAEPAPSKDSEDDNKGSNIFEGSPLSIDSINLRSGWNYLPGTLVEAKTVNQTLKNSQTTTELYVNVFGTEASFKALSGKGHKLIHIATHGFFYMDRDSVKMGQDGFRLFENHNIKSRQSIEDKSLTRSGMLFSGCNKVLTGNKIPEGYEDGILYAKEIAQLDLRGLEHITLSACETGLGDITGEGVFGLQRAFKKAGAHSILMTLWKVDDNATRMLMSRFYHNYLSEHMPKAEALLDAQTYIKNFEEEIKNADGSITKIKKYEDPKYWAAFIILDAI